MTPEQQIKLVVLKESGVTDVKLLEAIYQWVMKPSTSILPATHLEIVQ